MRIGFCLLNLCTGGVPVLAIDDLMLLNILTFFFFFLVVRSTELQISSLVGLLTL